MERNEGFPIPFSGLFRSLAKSERAAVRYGFVTAVVIAAYNVLVALLSTGSGFEAAHLLIFLILFLAMAFAMRRASALLGTGDRGYRDRMVFGMTFSAATGLMMIAISGLLTIFNNEWVVSEISLPISNLGDFAANAMGLFFGCIGFGFIAAFVLTNVFNPE